MGIISTDSAFKTEGATTYYFKINDVEYNVESFEGSTSYAELTTLIDTAISGAGFGAKIVQATGGEAGEDIRVFNDAVRGSGSECALTNGTSGTDLFTNLNFWPTFRKPVVRALESSAESFSIERIGSGTAFAIGGSAFSYFVFPIYEGSGSATISGSAITRQEIPTVGTSFFGDTYYDDEQYGNIGKEENYIPGIPNRAPWPVTGPTPRQYLTDGSSFYLEITNDKDEILTGLGSGPFDPDGDIVTFDVVFRADLSDTDMPSETFDTIVIDISSDGLFLLNYTPVPSEAYNFYYDIYTEDEEFRTSPLFTIETRLY